VFGRKKRNDNDKRAANDTVIQVHCVRKFNHVIAENDIHFIKGIEVVNRLKKLTGHPHYSWKN